MKKLYTILPLALALAMGMEVNAQRFELLKFGDMDQWVTRNIKESKLLGGNEKQVFAIAPTEIDNSGKPYMNRGGSPWATSNVLASPMGIVKTSNAVTPEDRSGHGKCARLDAKLEKCKVIGMINMEVFVGGTMFLGRMLEPIKSTSDPYKKMVMGVPFTGKPETLRFDYKLVIPKTAGRIYSSGFGKKKELPGYDNAEAFIILQKRWEDQDGNLYAKRVGTGWEKINQSTLDWVNGHDVKIHYGDITNTPYYQPYMKLMDGERAYYAYNSKGKLVPVHEVEWDTEDSAPTHMLMMFSASSGEPYTGTVGLTFWVDNIGLTYKN